MIYRLDVKLKSGFYWDGSPVARTLEVAGSSTLESLCGNILDSLGFDFDHMYEFQVHHDHYEGAPPYANASSRCKVKLYSLGLKKKDKMTLEYDFGDSWIFEIKVQEIIDAKGGETRVIASTGSVVQYPDEDELWDEDEIWDEDEENFSEDDGDEYWDDEDEDLEWDLLDDIEDEQHFAKWNYHAPDALFEAAYEYKKAKLWKKLKESEVVALRFPDGRTGFLGIMGEIGEHCALSLSIGEEAFQAFRRLSTEEPVMTHYEEIERILQQDSLQLILDNKEFLQEEEIADARAYAAKHGIRLSGKNAFAHFQKFAPNHLPWHLDTEQEEQDLLLAAKAACFLADCLENKKPKELEITSIDGGECQVPLLIQEEDGFRFDGFTTLAPLKDPTYPTALELEGKILQKLRRMKGKGPVEAKLLRYPEPIQEDPEDAPYFPAGLFAIEVNTGYIIPPELMPSFDGNENTLVNRLLSNLADNKTKPSAFYVDDERTKALLVKAAKELGIAIEMKEELPALDEVLDHLFDPGYLDDVEQNDHAFGDHLMEIAEMVLDMPDSEIRSMPIQIRNDFKRIIEMGYFPEELGKKLRKKLKF